MASGDPHAGTDSPPAGADETVTVPTSRFGELIVRRGDVVQLPDGLLGFPDVTAIVAVPVNEDEIFWWLQAVDDPALAFLAMVPWAYFPDYEPVVPTEVQEQLEIDGPADAALYCLLTIHEDPHRFTANLLGPLVVNTRRRNGCQVVLAQDLPTRAELPQPS